jgi:hypothetical protein
MTTEEFSNEFDVLVDSYRRFKAYDEQAVYDSLEFDEYEKSLFLTKAQEEIVLELYKGYNGISESFEATEENRRYLQSLVVKKELEADKDVAQELNTYYLKYSIPEDLWFIVSESFIENSKAKLVTPVLQDNLYKSLENPFRRPNNKRALRMDLENKIVILNTSSGGEYSITYVKKLNPIILVTLNDITIDGKNSIQNCKLNDSLHKRILERAVALALQSKAMVNNKK